MALFKKKEKKVTTYDGNTGQKLEGPAPAKIPELEVPRPPAEEKPTVQLEEADYFEQAREYGFIEGLSYAIDVLRETQNNIIRKQRGG